jgi:hypothetical protein
MRKIKESTLEKDALERLLESDALLMGRHTYVVSSTPTP